MSLPQLRPPQFITDGGLETTLVFHDGIDLPDFAAFPLLDTEHGPGQPAALLQPYLDLAERIGTGIVLDTPTWRANLDWGARLGYDADPPRRRQPPRGGVRDRARRATPG